MSIKRNLPVSESAPQAPAWLEGGPSICLVVAKADTRLWDADQFGTRGTLRGFVIACPQSCAKGRPGYREASTKQGLSAIYLNTSEWVREIIFTDDYNGETDVDKLSKNFGQYRRLLGFARVSNDAKAGGCGHISRNVEVTKVNLVRGVLQETPLAGLHSSLAIGKAQDTAYQATTILIYQGDWQQKATYPVMLAVDEIGTPRRPIDVTGCEP